MSVGAKIKIYGRTYNIKKDDSAAVKPQELAAFVDSKMKELSKIKGGPTMETDLAILTALNIAQELLELKEETKTAREEIDQKTNQLVKTLAKELKRIESKKVTKSR